MKNLPGLIVALFICYHAVAQIPKAQKNTYVNDFAGVLTKDEITNLNKEVFNIEKQAHVQIAVVLVKKLPDEYNIRQFAVEIGKAWHVGKDQNGLVYVISISQHQQRMEVARNLTQFPAAKCAEIMSALKPYYQSENYGEGLQILIDKVKGELQIETAQTAAVPAVTNPATSETTQTGDQPDNAANTAVCFVIIIAIIVIIVVYISRRKRKQREIDNFYNQRSTYNSPNPGYPGQGYPNQPDLTLRDMATGAILGAAVGYAADTLLNDIDNQNINDQNFQDNNYTDQSFDPSMPADQSNDDDNNASNWGNWGDSGSSDDSSYDSGFSDDSSSGGSSDW